MTIRQRHDAIIRVLRRHSAVSVDMIAHHVKASRRTIIRDIGVLREDGYLIETEAGRGGGVRLCPRTGDRTSRLEVREVFALIVSVSTMRAAGNLPFAGLADTGLAKIEKSLSGDKARDLRRLLDSLHVGELSPFQDVSDLSSIKPDVLAAFEIGFLERRHLRFAYRDAKGTQTAREVEPQAMLILPPLCYIVGWDPGRDGFRYFRMDRISNPQIVEGKWFPQRQVPFANDVCPFREQQQTK